MKRFGNILLVVFALFASVASEGGTLADWRMDACRWSGTSGEVVDSSGNGYAGHAENGADTLGETPFLLCRYGDFVEKYVTLDTEPKLGETWSLSVWIRFPLVPGDNQYEADGYYYFVLASVEDTGDLGYFAKETDGDGYKWGVYDNDGKMAEIKDLSFSDGWHHIVQVVDGGGTTLYVDDEKIGSVDRYTKGDLLYLGTSTDDVDNQTIGAGLDEFKLFDHALSDDEIETIYTNEKNGTNDDGSARECAFCSYELSAEYRLDECRWDGVEEEVKDTSGHGYDLTAKNGANTEPGRMCRSGYFDTTGDKVAGTWDQTFDNQVTLTAWIKTTGGHQSYARVVEFSSHDGDYRYGTALAYDYYGKVIRGWTANSDADRSETVEFDLDANGYHDGQWHHLAFVYDGARVKLFVDGVKKAEKESDISDIDDPETLVIGGYYPNDLHGFNGNIDEVKIFSKALDDLQVFLMYRNERAGRNFEGSLRQCRCVMPRADIRMDECSWNGTKGEIRDETGHGFGGTGHGATTLLTRWCRGGDFRADGTEDYAVLNHEALNGLEDFSVAVWIRTENENAQAILSGANADSENGNEALMWLYDSTTFKAFVHEKSAAFDIPDIADGEWHHFVWTRKGVNNCLFLDGESRGCKQIDGSEGALVIDEGGLIVAQEQDSVGGDFDAGQDFEGLIDELKIYGEALDPQQVGSLYDYERRELGYDGLPRSCLCCAARGYDGEIRPLQFQGERITLTESTDAPHWTHVDFPVPFDEVPVVFILPESRGPHPAAVRIKNVTAGGFDAVMAEPQGEDGPHADQEVNYLAITPGIHRIGHTIFEVGVVSTDQVQQASQGSSVKEEWETVSTLFSECNPSAVVQLQSLNNEKGLDLPDESDIIRSKPWLTGVVVTARGEVKVALERSETDEESVDEKESVGYMIAEGDVRDAFTDNSGREIRFETLKKFRYFLGWDNRCLRLPFAGSYDAPPLIAAGKNSRIEKDGGWFRRCYLDNGEIGLLIDEDGSVYSDDDYEYKEPPQDRERAHVGEDAGIFLFSESFVIGDFRALSGVFDAWDPERSLTDRNISTKTAGRAFFLHVASLNPEGSDYREFNGTVCLRPERKNDGLPLGEWNKILFEESNLSTAEFVVNRAATDVQLRIAWKRDVDESCPLEEEENATYASDLFAVRPERFLFLEPAETVLTSEHAYLYPGGVVAVMADGATATADYNASTPLGTLKRMRDGDVNESLAGTVETGFSSFRDGSADLNLSFDDTAIVTLELNDTTWCAVDADDTPEINRTVYGAKTVTFRPAYFELSFPVAPAMEDNDTDGGFTYLSEELRMGAWLRNLELNVTVKGEKGGVMRNFSGAVSGPLFADPVDLSPAIRLPRRHSDANVSNEPLLAAGVDLGFSGGEAMLRYADVAFNYARKYDEPVAPFFLSGAEGNISVVVQDSRHPEVAGSVVSGFSGGATFYYGRLRGSDVRTTEPETLTLLELEVYAPSSSGPVSGFRQNSLHWFRNEKHRRAASGGVVEANATAGPVLGSGSDDKVVMAWENSGDGVISLEINNTDTLPKTRTIHLAVDSWLWYVPKGFGKAYDDAPGSDCSAHPCLTYTFEAPGTATAVRSGDFNGSDFDAQSLDANATYRRRQGVKLFR